MHNLSGLLAVLTTPFHEDKINTHALCQHIKLLLPYVNGFVIGGTTGESFTVTDDEIKMMLRAAKTVADDKPIVAGFWRPTARKTLEAAKDLSAHVDALLVPIPADLFHVPEVEIEKFFLNLSESVSAPILLYNYPTHCENRIITPELAANLARKSKRIIGVKDSSADAALALGIIKQQLPLQVFIGNDKFLYRVLRNAQETKNTLPGGSMSGACSVPHIAKSEGDLYKLVADHNYDAAEELQAELTKEFDSWHKHIPELGGQAPLIKFLVNQHLNSYPLGVRKPLQQFTKAKL